MIALAVLLAVITVPLYGLKVFRKGDYTDFSVYYRAAERMAASTWDEVYTLADGASPFRYAPLTLPLFRPWAELPPETARTLWYGFQVLFFVAGFACLRATLRRVRAPDPTLTVALTFLFTLRLLLDTFTIGQVSSLIFLCFAAALLAWVWGRPRGAALWLLPPAILKIGPGVAFGALLAARPRRVWRAATTTFAALAVWTAAAHLWILSAGGYPGRLWPAWVGIVRADSDYYDASHYGSQSIQSALLRFAKTGWLTDAEVSGAWLAAAALILGASLFLWCFRRPRSARGRALSAAWCVFPYVWLMPETFKYTLTLLALPIALLLAELARGERRFRLAKSALVATAIFISLAGKDVIGDTLFFGIQRASLPLVATLLLGSAVWRETWRHTELSAWGRRLSQAFRPLPPGPWPHAPAPERPEIALSLLLPLPLEAGVTLNEEAFTRFVEETLATLQQTWPGRHEVWLLPFGDRVSPLHPLAICARALAGRYSQLKILESTRTRGLALRQGVLHARGTTFAFAQAEQPCAPRFYSEAHALLARGEADLVRANRRLGESRFRVPVHLLSYVYGRHRLGVLFNRSVRLLLPVGTSDTHSRTWLASRRTALSLFACQASDGFLLDLELALAARGHRLRVAELPVTLLLIAEKSFRAMGAEVLQILFGIPRLAWRNRQGHYARPPESFLKPGPWITADDWGLSPGVNEGILALARLGVIKRVSAMARGRSLEHGLAELKALPEVKIGLHFDLTHGGRSPGRVLIDWVHPSGARRARARESVREAFTAQASELERAGIEIRYLDGHHHIHLAPGMITALAPLLEARGIREVRLPYESRLWFGPKAAINLLSVLARGSFRKHGLRWLPCHYPSSQTFADPGRLRADLARRPGTEVITHPASRDDIAALGIPDSYTAGRVTEFRALSMLHEGPA